MKVGVTGHQRIADGTSWTWVEESLLSELCSFRELEGISSLAIGADQLFARCILALHGKLKAVIPFPDYRRTFANSADLAEFERLRGMSFEVVVLPDLGEDEACFLEAGKHVVDLSDLVFAVWDGKPAKGKGGTGDIVAHALRHSKRILQFEPNTKQIKELTLK